MQIETCRAGAVVKADYCALVRCEVEFEVPEGYPKILLFYQKAAAAAVRWSEEILGEKAQKEYKLLPDLWAKARFLPYRFRLRGKPIFEDSGHFAVVCESVLLRGSERSVRRAAQVWEKREQTILPGRETLRRFGGKKAGIPKGFRADGWYPANGELVFFRNPDSKSPFSEKKIKIILK